MAKKFRIIEPNRVICRQGGRYIGWPTIGRSRSGQLIVAFSGDRDGHICPFGKTYLVRSDDDGKTWGQPELVNNSPLDDRDAGLCVCSDGTLIVSWFASHYTADAYLDMTKDDAQKARWREHLAAVSKSDIEQWSGAEILPRADLRRPHLVGGRHFCGHWVRRSSDGGKTWEQPVRVPTTAPHGPIELSDGRLIYVGNNAESLPRNPSRGAIVAAESRDKGRTWQAVGEIDMYPQYPGSEAGGVSYLAEPHVVEVSPGHLLTMARYEEVAAKRDPARGYLWQSDSFDGGRTWTKPTQTPIWGKPPHLLRLADGRILVTYGHRREPFGQRACLSADGGKTWQYDNEFVLCTDGLGGDLGYPSSVQLADGTIYTAYYQRPRLGAEMSVMATHWAID